MVLTRLPVEPPPKTALVSPAAAERYDLEFVKSPKSVPFPAAAIVIYSITFV